MDNSAVDPLVADNTKDESDELFADDEQKNEIKHKSNVSDNVSILRLETPVSSLDNSSTIMPIDAVFSSAPLSLLSLFNKINKQWSSDLKTPQTQACAKSMTSSTIEEMLQLKQHTPNLLAIKSIEKYIFESSAIASRATRRCSRRCIFTSPISTDPLAVTNNENIPANVKTPVVANSNSVAANASMSTSSLEITVKDRVPKIPNNSLDTCNNEDVENVTNAILDSLNTSTQELCCTASFDNINDVCSDTFDNDKTTKTTAMQYDDEQNIEDIDKGRNVEENKNINFFTARGTLINVSKQALFKAKRLFADAFDANKSRMYESFAKRTSNEEKHSHLSSSLFATNVSFNRANKVVVEPKPFTEHVKMYDKRHTVGRKKSFTNKHLSEAANTVPVLFSTVGDASINISKEALSKAKMLDESENAGGDNVVIKHFERSSASKTMMVKNMRRPSFVRNNSINISKKSPPTIKNVFAERANSISVNLKNKRDISDNEQRDFDTLNIGVSTTRRDTPVVMSKRGTFKTKTLFAQHIDDSLKDINNNDNEMKRQEKKVSKVGFQTVGGKISLISKPALSRATAVFAKHLDATLKAAVAEESKIHDTQAKGVEIKRANISVQATESCVDISKKKSKAKISLRHVQDAQLKPVCAKDTERDAKMENKQVTRPNRGFQIACGTFINISKQALSGAKTLFADHVTCSTEMDRPDNICADARKIKKRNLTQSPHDGPQTVSGQRVLVLNTAAIRARDVVFHDCLNDSTFDLERTSLQKRKLNETTANENTPQDRTRAFDTKKARLNSDVQARNAFSATPSVDATNMENLAPHVKNQAPFIATSALRSPNRDAIDARETAAAGSPVLGGQLISRMGKKSLRYRRNQYSALQKYRKIPIEETTALQKNCVQRAAIYGKRKDANVNTQKSTQVAKKRAKSGSTDVNDYGAATQVTMACIDDAKYILQTRWAAALKEQEARIIAKRQHGSKHAVDHLYRYKQTTSTVRLSLMDISGGRPPVPRSSQELRARRISPNILDITAANAATYRLRCSDFYETGATMACDNVCGIIEMEDYGTRLIADENGDAGVDEFLRAFLASAGVDPTLVPAGWVENHYRWIVWKLASIDRQRFGSIDLPRVLTPLYIMAQLKYRYDREIGRSERPALRRILEKNDAASKRMILCVSSIIQISNADMKMEKQSPRIKVPKWTMNVTDGWYTVTAGIDMDMVKNIACGKVREGTKLMISGAELVNCDRGCSPLEIPADVCLKLHTNSTRRAQWDTKLGYAPCSGPIPIELRTVCPNGGLIGAMTVVVARVYPMLYCEKNAAGDSIVRNAKNEEKVYKNFEQQICSKIEAFHAKANENIERGKGLDGESDEDVNDMIRMRRQLFEDYEKFSTEDAVYERRTHDMKKKFCRQEEKIDEKLRLKLRESLPGPRKVAELLKVRVCDAAANAVLSIWSPSNEVVAILKEGACISLRNIMASGKRGIDLQLTARSCARITLKKMRDTSYPARVCVSLDEIATSKFAPLYAEFDTVGFVCAVGPAPHGMKNFEAVHLAARKTASSDESSYLSILFWQGIARYSYKKIFTVGTIVACSNLEWRRATLWNVPAAYCTEKSTFTHTPRQQYLCDAVNQLRHLITSPRSYVERCTLELKEELQKKSTTSTRHY